MAAEALISDLVGKLTTMVVQKVEQEVRLVGGVKKEVNRLQVTLETIESVVEDADQRQVRNKSVKRWLEDLKDVGYDMEDLLEDWILEVTSKQHSMKEKVLSFLSSPCVCFKPVAFRSEIAHRIKDIRERLDSINEEKNQFQLAVKTISTFTTGGILRDDDENRIRSREMTSSVIDASEVCGRVIDKYTITSKLGMISESSSTQQHEIPKVPIIAVVGMGGLGKTTLAQLVYNDQKVVDHFKKENMWWVCVSDPFDKVRLAKAIIAEAGGQVPGGDPEWNALHNRLSEDVKDKRFLLVLDDVWTEDFRQWEPFKTSLERGSQGSRILVTTRSEKVAHKMNAFYIHRMRQLPEPDCWSLFSRIAFAGRAEEERLMLKEIGKEIANRCKGVPLSIKTVAGFLSEEKHKEDWERISKSNIWNEPEVEGKILPSLLLSYYALLPNLKRCFVYCAVFPKGTKLQKDELIKLWMANGFLSLKGEKESERIGEKYFEDLVMRSFFQDVKTEFYENCITCKMHDLVHDLAQYVTTNEILVMETSGQISDRFDSSKIRHLTIPQRVGGNFALSAIICNKRKLRTLQIKIDTGDISEIFCRLRFLRVLDLQIYNLTEFPRDVEKLKHLRYFKLVLMCELKLPETLCNLHNLKTLIIDGYKLQKLPEGIGKMTNLRHLQTIGLAQQCLSLEFKQLRKAGDINCIVSNMSTGGCELGRRIPFQKLKELQIRHCNLLEWQWPEEDNVDIMPQLQKFCLQGCKNLRVLPPLGKLKFLKVLEINGIEPLARMGPEFFGISYGEGAGDHGPAFPELEYLNLSRMNSLALWEFPVVQDPKNIMPCLRELIISHCPELKEFPDLGILESLEKLEMCGNGFSSSLWTEEMDSELHVNNIVGSTRRTAFPSLISLTLSGMVWFGEWESALLGEEEFMPCLRYLSISNFPRTSKSLPPLGKLKSLESLIISDMRSIECVGLEFWGISDDGGEPKLPTTAFPKLKRLEFRNMNCWLAWSTLQLSKGRENDEGDDGAGGIEDMISITMPCLNHLLIEDCPCLTVIPPNISSHTPWKLEISNCPDLQMTSTQGMSNLQELILEDWLCEFVSIRDHARLHQALRKKIKKKYLESKNPASASRFV